MKTKIIKGLSQVQSKYDTFFIDLWGVIHNGIHLYSEAINVLKNLNKLEKKFVLISNAPRQSKIVEKYLINLKMDKVFLKNIFTSGEAALLTLKKNWRVGDSTELFKISFVFLIFQQKPKNILFLLLLTSKTSFAVLLVLP